MIKVATFVLLSGMMIIEGNDLSTSNRIYRQKSKSKHVDLLVLFIQKSIMIIILLLNDFIVKIKAWLGTVFEDDSKSLNIL